MTMRKFTTTVFIIALIMMAVIEVRAPRKFLFRNLILFSNIFFKILIVFLGEWIHFQRKRLCHFCVISILHKDEI